MRQGPWGGNQLVFFRIPKQGLGLIGVALWTVGVARDGVREPQRSQGCSTHPHIRSFVKQYLDSLFSLDTQVLACQGDFLPSVGSALLRLHLEDRVGVHTCVCACVP